MYGLIVKLTAVPGGRDELTTHLLENYGRAPGCLSYVVAHDALDQDGIWVTEAWTGEAAHRVAYQTPELKAAVARGLPLVATFGDAQITSPVGGTGLTGRS